MSVTNDASALASAPSSLQEVQLRLHARLQGHQVDVSSPQTQWLSVSIAGQSFAIALSDAGEIHTMIPPVPVAHTQAWFLGVANVRGSLLGVVDLAVFLGLSPANDTQRHDHLFRPNTSARYVCMPPDIAMNTLLIVDQLAGLRSDEQAKIMNKLDLRDIARRADFLEIYVKP